jgi:hypothetical protein
MAKVTPEIFEAICSDLETTWEGLVTLCKKHDVNRGCFYDYKDKIKENTDRYVRAREKQLDYLEELMVDISMDKNEDLKTEDRVNVGGNAIARARLQVDTIKFVLAKLRANVWGDRTKIEGTFKIENVTGMEIL